MAEKSKYDMVMDKAGTPEFKDRWARQDIDEALYFMKAYEMLRPDNKPMKDVINVTFNDPTTFAARAIATLGSAQRQTVVTGREMTDKQNAVIENFIDDMTVTVDEQLAKEGTLDLDTFINEQVCIRGGIGSRNTIYKELDKKEQETGRTIIKVLTCDERFLVWERGSNGLDWEAHLSSRSPAKITKEYGKEIGDKVKGTKPVEVVDLWTPDENLVYIDKKEAVKQKNIYGYPPFTNAKSAAGSMLSSAEAKKHDGESIFWMNRGLFPELNRTASIFQTINVGSFAGAMQYASDKGARAKKPQKPPWGIYSVTPVEKGGGYTPVPVNDIRAAARLFYAILYTRVQQGGLSAIDYGNLTFPLSAVAITRLTASRDQIFIPRIQAKAVYYRELFKMLIDQFIKVGGGVKLGEEGYLNEYTAEDLKGSYQIKFRFYTESKEQRIANLSVATAARGMVSDHTIRRTTLEVQDPEAEEEHLALEDAMRNDEAVFLYTRCSKLIAMKRNLEAWILYYRLRDTLRLRKRRLEMPAGEEAALKEPGKGSQIMPLLASGDHGGTLAPEIGEEEKTVRQTEREEQGVAEAGAKAKQEEVR